MLEQTEKNMDVTTHIKFEPSLLERMDLLIDDAIYSSRNELIRDAVRHLIQPYIDSGYIGKKISEVVRFKE